MSLPPEKNMHFNDNGHTNSLRETVPTVPLNKNIARVSTLQRIRQSGIFLAGIIVGIILVLLFLLLFSFDRSAIHPTPTPSSGSITAAISRSYLTLLVTKQLKSSGLPGTVSNVQVTLAQNNLMTISGDDQFGVLGLSLTKHFTLTLQVSVVACQLHVKVIHADLDGIPVTGFATLFESQLNRQVQSQQSGFPSGFVYCLSGVQTTTNNFTLFYTATPAI